MSKIVEIKIIEMLINDADRLKIDRDIYIRDVLERLSIMAEISTFKSYEVKEANK